MNDSLRHGTVGYSTLHSMKKKWYKSWFEMSDNLCKVGKENVIATSLRRRRRRGSTELVLPYINKYIDKLRKEKKKKRREERRGGRERERERAVEYSTNRKQGKEADEQAANRNTKWRHDAQCLLNRLCLVPALPAQR